MPLDEHRAPNRLAHSYPTTDDGSTPYSQPPSQRPIRAPDYGETRVDDYDPDYDVQEQPYWTDAEAEHEQQFERPSQPDRPSGDNGEFHHEAAPDYEHDYEVAASGEGPAMAAEVHEPPAAPPPPEEEILGPGELTKQELHGLLMRTVEHYRDRWQLASIRVYPDRRMLVAYLTPRQKPMGLKEAISKRKVMVVSIDCRGNTDIKTPRKRGWLRSLVAWIAGD